MNVPPSFPETSGDILIVSLLTVPSDEPENIFGLMAFASIDVSSYPPREDIGPPPTFEDFYS